MNFFSKVLKYGGFFLLLLSLHFPSFAQNNKVTLTLNPGPENPRNSEGDFIKLKDGRLLFAYTHYDGESSGDNASAHIAGRYSNDRGRTWTVKDEKILASEGGKSIRSVSLLRLKDGAIALFYMRANSRSDCIPMMHKSYDEAKTWSDPVRVIQDKEGYFVLNNDRVIQLKNGRILAPVSRHNAPGKQWHGTGNIFCYYSDDNGKTWKSSKEVPNPGDVMLQEPGIIVLKNGQIMMFMRTDEGVQYLAYSSDQGETWTSVKPSTIPSPRSPASIERIPSTGDLLMIWNNNGLNQNRTPFNSVISKDEGKTWTRIRSIADDPDGWYCYTAIHFTGGEVLLGHCAGNRPQGTGLAITNITRLDLDWVYGQEEK